MRQRVATLEEDLAALNSQLEKIQGEAITDPLTGLKNRRGLQRALDDFMASQPEGIAGNVLLMADIDHFKRVKDSYGIWLGTRYCVPSHR